MNMTSSCYIVFGQSQYKKRCGSCFELIEHVSFKQWHPDYPWGDSSNTLSAIALSDSFLAGIEKSFFLLMVSYTVTGTTYILGSTVLKLEP